MIDPLLALIFAALAAGLTGIIFWPEKGLFQRWTSRRLQTERVLSEDALKHIHKGEMKGRKATLESVAGAAQVTLDGAGALLSRMEAQGLVTVQDSQFLLTPEGRGYALHVIRTHRLWERFLADKTGYEHAEWHRQAEEYEHRLSPLEADALSAKLGNPTHDPHGDPIPTSEGKLVEHGGESLTSMPLDRRLKIVHIEDEPPAVYAQLVAEGLYPGMIVRVTENVENRVRFWADGEESVLAPIIASNISVQLVPEEEAPPQVEKRRRLSEAELGSSVRVLNVSPACRGLQRRRFMDLGILPGTQIDVQMRSPGGDPTAYRIRGSTIALRRDQAGLINVTPLVTESEVA